MARKRDNKPERVSGTYSAFPHIVGDSESFKGASDKAKALLFALIRQLNGKNNGHLQLTKKWLAQQGYTCPDSNNKARDELIERGLIVQTKFGGLNIGANLFAVTWLDISNPVGLDVSLKDYCRGAYLLCKLPPTPRRKPPKKQKKRFSQCTSAGSVSELDDHSTSSVSEPEKRIIYRSTGSVSENNVIKPIPIRKNRIATVKKRIVGVRGRSGVSTLN